VLPFYGPDDPLFRETVVPTRSSCCGSSTGFHVEKTADYMGFISELIEGRTLVGWSGYVATNCYRNEIFEQLEEHGWRGTVRSGLHPPGTSHCADPPAYSAQDRELQTALRKMIMFLYRRVLDPKYNGALPPPGTLRRQRNWDARGPYVLRRALVEKSRATTGQRRKRTRRFDNASFTKFLYEASPKPMFGLIMSFL
jgi:hypothetical protein